MEVETLRKYRRQEPFQPLRLHLTDGSSIEVRHPQLLLIATRMILVGTPSPRHPEYPDVAEKTRMLTPDQIVSVELLAEPSVAS